MFILVVTGSFVGMTYQETGIFRQKNLLLKRYIELEEQQWVLQQIDVAKTFCSLGMAYRDLGHHQKQKALLSQSRYWSTA